MKCPLCSAGNVDTEVEYGLALQKHLETHEHEILALALSSLYDILNQKKMNREKKPELSRNES